MIPRLVSLPAILVMLATGGAASAGDMKFIAEAGYAHHEWSQPLAACFAAGCQDARNVDLGGPYGRVSLTGNSAHFWLSYESLSAGRALVFTATDAGQMLAGALTETIKDVRLTQLETGAGWSHMGSVMGVYAGYGTGLGTFKKTNVVSYSATGDWVSKSSVSYWYMPLAAGLYVMPFKHLVLSANLKYVPEALVIAPTPLGSGLHVSGGAGLAF